MPNYWEQAAEENEQEQYEQALKAYAEIMTIFRLAGNNLKRQIEQWLRRMTDGDELNMAQAMQTLTFDQLLELRQIIADYVQNDTISTEWKQQMQKSVALPNLTKLSALSLLVRHQLESAYSKENSKVNTALKKLYLSGYEREASTIARRTGIALQQAKTLSDYELEAILSEPWAKDGKTFSDRIWNNKEKMVERLQTELTNTILRGGDIDSAIANMTEFVDSSVKNANSAAERLLVTEGAAISAKAKKAMYEEISVDKYTIVAVLDERTSAICRELNGKIYNTDWYKVGETAPPFHPHCRTTTAPYFDGEIEVHNEWLEKNIVDKLRYPNLQRKNKNLPPFDHIQLPIQKKTIVKVTKKHNVDISNLTIKIQRGDDMEKAFFAGMTDYDHIGRIDLTPLAFTSEEELIRTIIHERCHVKQLRKYGKQYCLDNLEYMENVAERYEEMWYNMIK